MHQLRHFQNLQCMKTAHDWIRTSVFINEGDQWIEFEWFNSVSTVRRMYNEYCLMSMVSRIRSQTEIPRLPPSHSLSLSYSLSLYARHCYCSQSKLILNEAAVISCVKCSEFAVHPNMLVKYTLYFLICVEQPTT